MAEVLPAFSAVYGLNWDDHIVKMPRRERDQYMKQLEQWANMHAAGTLSSENESGDSRSMRR